MRAEVDQELQKINDLYDKRCRDYAHMVSEECDSEESKAVAGERPGRIPAPRGVEPSRNRSLQRPRPWSFCGQRSL